MGAWGMSDGVAEMETAQARKIRDFARWERVQMYLRAACDEADSMADGQRVLGEALCAMLDTVGGGSPRYQGFGDMRADAEWWADLATPVELELYAGAALKRIARTPFAPRAKRRLMAALWQSLTVEERQAFLARVARVTA